ncbi:hypothetical protein SEVIR_3G371901v4 [Setaria viridis]|uniref:Translation initiation factor 5A-like N-terminal domain-containing protein n=1 Tax=Setaria viridis TaxID=4556 RepID=A0A4U6VJY0_SETVI|nr:hypothetical protein SEVIR_3G371901v2 [Setaria viridis]TKW29075.1 hypothetical protein SEVIR_3G371901v2 [Setaria viridis]
MSDSEDHQFDSKADAGASKTYPQQAGTVRKNGYLVIKNRPCKVVEVSTSKTGKHGHASVTLLLVTSSMARSLKILSHLLTTVMFLM